jgi:hypothetical protein
VSYSYVRTDQRLNGARLSGLDPLLSLGAATMVQALADVQESHPAQQAEARDWLTRGAGAQWCELLGADELLADALAGMD